MTAHALVISPAAKADLKDIYEYGLRQWGQVQSDRYLNALKDRLWLLTEQPLIGSERSELISGMRSLPIDSHVLFYRVSSSLVEIVRVLHARQDPIRHFK